MKSKFMLMLLIVLLAFIAMPLLAQDEEPAAPQQAEVVPDESVFGAQLVSEPTPADDAARTLLEALYTIVYIPMAAPLIVILVNVMKTVPLFDRFSSQVLTFIWNAVIWILFTLMKQAGYGGYFDSILNSATTIATLLLAVLGSQLASNQLYNVARDNAVPVIGYNRPEILPGAVG